MYIWFIYGYVSGLRWLIFTVVVSVFKLPRWFMFCLLLRCLVVLFCGVSLCAVFVMLVLDLTVLWF